MPSFCLDPILEELQSAEKYDPIPSFWDSRGDRPIGNNQASSKINPVKKEQHSSDDPDLDVHSTISAKRSSL